MSSPASASELVEAAALAAAGRTVHQPRPSADDLRAQLAEAARLLDLTPHLIGEPSLVFLPPGADAAEMRAIGKGLTVGRGETCDLYFSGRRELSRSHFAVRREADLYYVEDLGSSNGTVVKGCAAPIQRRELRDGDLIAAGALVFLFVRGE